jgi:hypothetical protein
MSILKVGKAVYSLLKDIAPVFPLVADEGTKYPFIVYKRTSTNTLNSKDVYNFQELAMIELNIAAEDYEGSVSLAEKVKEKLEHYRGQVEGITIRGISMTDSSEDWMNDCYAQRLMFEFNIENNK